MKSCFLKLLLVMLFSGCTHKFAPVRSLEEKDLFPNGNYTQEVVVKVLAEGHKKDFDFNSLVQKNTDSFHLVGYNSFGISLFKVKENKGIVEMESSIKEINKRKDFFLKVFTMVKTLINIKAADSRIKNDSLTVDFQGAISKVNFKDYDKAGIPLKIEINSPHKMNVQITTTEYTFK